MTAWGLLGAVNEPVVVEPSWFSEFISGTVGLVVIGVLACITIGTLLVAGIELLLRERKHLVQALRPYSNDQERKRDLRHLADTDLIKRAVASTARLADDRGVLEKVNRRLEQADLPLKAGELLFFSAAATAAAAVIGGAFLGILGIALGGFLFAFLPFAVTGFLASQRKRKFTSQLPDTLQLLAGSLRAGYSLVQGIDAVAKQCEEPMAGELQRALSEARLGRPVELALEDVATRMRSDDFEWAVMAIKIQREVGGNLAELLMTVSETMVQRERMRREVQALTAEGRISAIVLSGLPPLMGLVIGVLNPEYMEPLLTTWLGQVALIGAGLMIVTGYFVMNKLTKIEA